LEQLNVSCCEWFVDEMLDRLVQGQINRLGGRASARIPLKKVEAFFVGVTQQGAQRVVDKDGVGQMIVTGGNKVERWRVNNSN
jgi:hypothetical protein